MAPLPHDVAPGERALIGFSLTLPKGLGDWELTLSFVEQNVAWFDQQGVTSLSVRIGRALAEHDDARRARAIAGRVNTAFYAPSQGIARSRDGRVFPLVVQEASGAWIRDAAGNEWIDYVMGWGSALLGYAHPTIRAALSEVLDCGPVISLPHTLEMEVTETLCELIPCAEQVLFGKNGSDVCTAAVRAARLHTGRDLILFSGYHGWQEPFAQSFEPALLATGESRRAISFRLNDLEGLCSLVKAHAGQIAAIVLEPAGQAEGVEGPVRDCDPAFLRHVAEICREQGALLVFDEIMTGFRYPQGSVQRATGVIPDLAVFGKALGGGLPLSVLVGRQQILGPTLSRLFYHPTFKGDVYAFAAAAAALRLYRTQDVARQIREIGGRLQAGVNAISQEIGVAGRLIGLPYRMVYRFDEPDDRRRSWMRTLLQQELLEQGVLTFRGFMLPSLAHGEREIDQTLLAFRSALTTVERVTREDAFVAALEIPPIV
jgi:glutamate-1-semialdehyde aminotransferase